MSKIDLQTKKTEKEKECYEWENPGNGRYYIVYIIQDLLEDWLVVTLCGNKRWHKSRKKVYLCASHEEALKLLHKINQTRQQHSYQLRSSNFFNLFISRRDADATVDGG
jgi:hypothetical protein